MNSPLVRMLFQTVALSLLYACTGSAARDTVDAAEHFNARWATQAMWEQGTAEVAKYQAQRTIYQQVRDFEYTFILVKRDLQRKVPRQNRRLRARRSVRCDED